MRKERKILIAVLTMVVVGLMASPAFARRQYRSTMVGPTRWVSEPAYERRPEATQSLTVEPAAETPIAEKSDVANAIDGTAEFVGDTAWTIGTAFGETVEATGEVGGGILTWVGDATGAIGGFVGETFDFLFGDSAGDEVS